MAFFRNIHSSLDSEAVLTFQTDRHSSKRIVVAYGTSILPQQTGLPSLMEVVTKNHVEEFSKSCDNSLEGKCGSRWNALTWVVMEWYIPHGFHGSFQVDSIGFRGPSS
ncbi:uncharacterized protein LACBIDRAFT_322940 [Laccaria bicolor S238N-H82]|uniref:Predicted protein n=1 Tax=Laccaria bicolor (strain S238N-H82 / ATCC MYA-4686) TaxID=486041 RepID=B0CVM2_LACBS|nr:uncharacterized protein LACBIDRAFT_322940 [Laccaria bicolor S238N-H82]EDR13769.1 predicted protein [Laccaria bicolor S238N-H82]|eukprot:XP_001876267.1 predicted protein [Laccaria bicolor S238N-H82]